MDVLLRPTFGGSLVLECGFRVMWGRTECDDLLLTKAAGEFN